MNVCVIWYLDVEIQHRCVFISFDFDPLQYFAALSTTLFIVFPFSSSLSWFDYLTNPSQKLLYLGLPILFEAKNLISSLAYFDLIFTPYFLFLIDILIMELFEM